MSAEHVLFTKYKIDPIAFESNYTVFDFTFFIDNLMLEIKEEIKEKEKNGENKLIRLLRIMKGFLNKYEI